MEKATKVGMISVAQGTDVFNSNKVASVAISYGT